MIETFLGLIRKLTG